MEDPSFDSEGIVIKSEKDGGDNEDNYFEENTDHPLDDNSNRTKRRKYRPKKKKLYKDICSLIEFYMSDANISKNRMMQNLVKKSEEVSLETFMSFNKLKTLTTNIQDVQKALKISETLELTEDKLRLSRKIKYDPNKLMDKEMLEQCTIYVENIPLHANHDWIEKIFQEFGPISYISLPKYKFTGQLKGFGFVEFGSPESAQRCLEAYGEFCLDPNNLEPSSLQSIKTFDEENSEKKDKNEPKAEEETLVKIEDIKTEKDLKKRKNETAVECDSSSKKGKFNSSSSSSSSSASSSESSAESDAEQNNVTSNNEKDKKIGKKRKLEEDEIDQNESNKKNKTDEIVSSAAKTPEKSRKKRRRKNKKLFTQEKLESDSIQIRILPKKMWRQLRNKYLNIQRENMSRLKKQLRQHRNALFNDEEEKLEPKKTKGTLLTIVIKFEFIAKPENFLALKSQLEDLVSTENHHLIRFIDYIEGSSEAYIRFEGDSQEKVAYEFMQKAEGVFKNVKILNVNEKTEYFDAVRRKLREKTDKKPMRGRDKIIQQAVKKASHIKFDDDDD